jgi:hypothetical protein
VDSKIWLPNGNNKMNNEDPNSGPEHALNESQTMNKIKPPGRALALAALALLSTLNAQLSTLRAQGTAFTYQGLLQANGSAANDNYDLTFAIFDHENGAAQVGATITNSSTAVSNGLFTVTLDFRPGIFTGPRRWLEIGSRPTGSGADFVILATRQELTPAPYAIFAASAGAATGVAASAVSAPQLNTTGGPTPGQVLSYNGSNLVWIAGGGGGGSSNAWLLGGNAGTTDASFLGTTDNHPLELRVNNARGLRLELNSLGASANAPNVIGGAIGNFAAPFSVGATIAGGGALNYGADPGSGDPGQSYTNSITGDFGTVSGGGKNASAYFGTVGGGEGNSSTQSHATVGGGAGNHSTGSSATIGGGVNNTSSGSSTTVAGGAGNTSSGDYSAVSGGNNNAAHGSYDTIAGGEGNSDYLLFHGLEVIDADHASIGGGLHNSVLDYYATIAGGASNYAGAVSSTVGGGFQNSAEGQDSTVAGGSFNTASGIYSTVAGGTQNSAMGQGSFAGGQNAHANHDGSFVWGDGTGWAGSAGPNRFEVRATGGFNFYSGPHPVTIDPSGTLNVPVLTIYGGSDVAEPFQMSMPETPKGAVVIIDEENPGRLKLSDRAYDRRVAGIVSGANGIQPGISLSQQGVVEGGQNVALSGRVYVLADTSSGPIKAGDLLTTSNTPGHAMKVTDHSKAQGAILGKAMSPLGQGEGMVLVLVTLQ